MDPNEIQQRRQQRQLEREKHNARRKKARVRNGILAIAASLVLIVGIVIIGTLLSDHKQTASQPEATAPTQNPEEVTTIHLAAAGDLNLTSRIISSGGPEQDYTNAFLDVVPALANADITVMNFEGVVGDSAEATDRVAPVSMVEALSKAGVDLLQLANSYSIHKGVSGLQTTIQKVRGAGLTPLGVYENRAAYREGRGYVLCETQGIRVAFVAFTKGMDGMALPGGSENCVNVLYEDYASAYQKVDTDGIREVLSAVAEEEPDLTVALLHWGSEYNDNISKTQETIRDLLLDGGVDAIIGTHSHFVQKMELDPEAGTFVAYSLGDFFGEAPRAGSEYSVILDLEITKNNRTGETAVSSFSYTPIFSVRESGKRPRVVQISTAMKAYESGHVNAVSQQTYEDMVYALERIDARITGEDK